MGEDSQNRDVPAVSARQRWGETVCCSRSAQRDSSKVSPPLGDHCVHRMHADMTPDALKPVMAAPRADSQYYRRKQISPLERRSCM